jgi:hypothetical protein
MSERARIRVPSHVAARTFSGETVLLNLATGEYHGLDSTGGAFLAALERNPDVAAAFDELLSVYAVDPAILERDLQGFCDALVERGLLEIEGDARE